MSRRLKIAALIAIGAAVGAASVLSYGTIASRRERALEAARAAKVDAEQAARALAARRIIKTTQVTTAFHEAGHVVVGAVLFGIDEIERVEVHELVDSEKQFGRTVKRDCNVLRLEDDWLAEISFTLGGRAAEKVLRGSMTDASYEDLKKSRRAIEHLRYISGIGKRLFTLDRDRGDDIREVAMDVDALNEDLVKQHDRAEAIIRENEKTARALTAQLLELRAEEGTRIMKTADLRTFFAKHKLTRPRSEKRDAKPICFGR